MIPPEGAAVDWSSAARASYLITQSFRYEYTAPIRNLKHRLVVIPPERFGDQRRLRHRVSAGIEGVRFENHQDRFGNVIVDAFAPQVSSTIEFLAEISVERTSEEPNRSGGMTT
ncbi:MAG TPA: transglutaminase N-terminal domain-containing protein, partial [Clostridia bacterium]|nr:transglutaminase N-terminal domain-containing protein [Clostridia bacterium]